MKKSSRRKFITTGLMASAGIAVAGSTLIGCKPKPSTDTAKATESSFKPLSILILGGTSFLGPHQIAYALSKGHKITTFTRGKTKPTLHVELFDEVEQLIGDRNDNLEALKGRSWDAVIDNSGHNVQWAKDTAELLKDKVGLYLFTSSTGVYYPYLGDNITEDTELLLVEPETVEHPDMKIEYWYGVMKANSEIAVREIFGEDRSIAVRPTYMIGPGDQQNRFIHWPVRLHRPGEVLVPGKADDLVQYIDARDVARFMIHLIESKTTGIFNAVGPAEQTSMYEFVDLAKKTFGAENELVYVDDYDFLTAQNVTTLVPWIHPEGNNYGSARINNTKGIAHGLGFTEFDKTLNDTYVWWNSTTLPQAKRDAFEKDPENVLHRETEILAAWKAKKA